MIEYVAYVYQRHRHENAVESLFLSVQTDCILKISSGKGILQR